jgi:hypothetical protein
MIGQAETRQWPENKEGKTPKIRDNNSLALKFKQQQPATMAYDR